MKTFLRTTAVLAALAAAIGCEVKVSKPPSTAEGPSAKKLTLYAPSDRSLNRGDLEKMKIVVKRENFSSPLTVSFSKLPSGVTVVIDKTIASDKDELEVALHAAPDADLVTDHVATVTVAAPDGFSASQTFKITVKSKTEPGP